MTRRSITGKSMSKRVKLGLGLLALAGVLGLLFSWQLFSASKELALTSGTASCEIGDGLSCAAALSSQSSKMFGVALPVWAGAFYFMVLTLVLGLWRDGEVEGSTPARFLTVTFGMAVALSIYLASQLFQLDTICPYCVGLYIVNLLGFGASWALVPKMGGLFEDFGKQAQNPLVWVSLVVFGGGAALFHTSYTQAIGEASKELAEKRGKVQAQAIDKLYGPDWEHIDLTGLPVKGNPDSPVKLIAFEDFECPPCNLFRLQSIAPLYSLYKDKIAIYFVHFPLSSQCNPNLQRDMHPGACIAATAASCAQRQDKFWEMHDALFDYMLEGFQNKEHRSITKPLVMSFADKLKLNPQQFTACLDDPAIQAKIKDQIAMGVKLNVRGTPSWTLNGHRPKEQVAPTVEYLAPQIERLLSIAADDNKAAKPKDGDEGAASGEDAKQPADGTASP